MTTTTAAPEAPAKRGDLVAIEKIISYTMVHGPTHRSTEWELGIVSSITREGFVKSADRVVANYPRMTKWWRNRGHIRSPKVLAATRLTQSPEAIILSIGDTFDTLDAARDAIRPFLG